MTDIADAVTEVLDDLLEQTEGSENRLLEAMRYSSLSGGKRVRHFWLLLRPIYLVSRGLDHCGLRQPLK